MKKFIYFILIVMIAAAAGCSQSIVETEETSIGASTNNSDFNLSIWTDKSIYSTDEPIECSASLEYIGESDLTVFHSDPLIVFYIQGGNFNGEWARQDSLNRTEFTCQEEIVIPFEKSGGWSSDDPNAEFFQEFYSEDELFLPPGEYLLWTQIEYSTDENDFSGSHNTLEVSVSITVQE